MRSLLVAVLALGCGGARPATQRIEHVSSEPPPPDLTTDPELLEFVLVVEKIADVAIAGQDCADRQTASRDIVSRWDACAEDPTWDAMYRTLFLGE